MKVLASTSNFVSENAAKIIALILGILCGCFYSSCFRHINESLVNYKADLLFGKSSPRVELPPQNRIFNETAQFLVDDDTAVADELRRNLRVLCWIRMKPVDMDRFDAIKNTWGGRCTTFIAIINSQAVSNHSHIFHVPADGNHTSNLAKIYRFIAVHYTNFDWFLHADPSAYVVVENLRYHLSAYDPNDSLAIGLLKNDTNTKQQHLSMQPAYALSRKAVKNLAVGFTPEANENCAAFDSSEEKLHFSRCLREAGISFGKSRDQHGKQLFFDQRLGQYFLPNSTVELPKPWYQDYKVNHNLKSASNYSIAFYGWDWKEMYVMEYSVYQLRPYNIDTVMPPLPDRIRLT